MKQTYIKVEETYNVVTDGLILYLDAKDTNSYPGTGTTWYDLSGNGHHAYGDPGANGAGTNSANFPTYQSTDGGRFYFDGTDGLTITTNMGSHTSLTADFWCYRNSDGDTQYFFDARNGGGTYWLSNYLNFNVNIGNIFKVNNPTTYNATSNWWYEWVNITITVNSSGSALYINGELYTTGPTFDSDLGQYFRIGNRYTSIDRWIGYWSNIRFYNRVLTSSEIEQNYIAVNSGTLEEWKPVTNVWVNNLGTWIEKVIPKINVSGTWKAAMEYIDEVTLTILSVGHGGTGNAGGGGGAEVRTGTLDWTGGTLSVMVGTNSSLSGITIGSDFLISLGGGVGGAAGQNGQNGGSGGGGGMGVDPFFSPGVGGLGNLGGKGGSGAESGGGGGGGAGGAGGNASPYLGGVGGTGISSNISGTNIIYGSGGDGFKGVIRTLGPGSGGFGNSVGGNPGVVIIRYTASSQLFNGGTVTTTGGDYVHTFTSSGTFVKI